jgi:hypothetical protein
MLSSLFGSSSEVIQIDKDAVRNIMENVGHGPLECSTYVLESKRHEVIGKGTPQGSKSSFILICWMDLDFIVAGEPIHKGQFLMVSTIIDNLVDERGWKVVFGTSMVEIAKVSENVSSSLFLVNKDKVGDP